MFRPEIELQAMCDGAQAIFDMWIEQAAPEGLQKVDLSTVVAMPTPLSNFIKRMPPADMDSASPEPVSAIWIRKAWDKASTKKKGLVKDILDKFKKIYTETESYWKR